MKRRDVRLLPQTFPASGIAPPSKPPVVNPETVLVQRGDYLHRDERPEGWDRADDLDFLEYLEGR